MSKKLTRNSGTQLQRLSSVSPGPRLRLVFATGTPEAEVTLHGLALEGTKQV